MCGVAGYVWVIDVLTQAAEITTPFRGSWDSGSRRSTNMSPLPLVVCEKEDFVLPNRTTKSGTKLVPISAGHAYFTLRKRVARKIGVRTLKIEERAVKFVGARFGLGSDDSADRLAEFGVVVLRSNLHFIDGIEVRIDYDDSEDGILVVGSVQFEAGPRKMLSVRQDLPRTLWVFAGRVTPTLKLRAGRQ